MTSCFYHYTDAQTALKILENKELWMTHTSYLNDSEEGKELRTYLNKKPVRPEINKVLDYIDKNFEVYVCSLSENGDLLSQWRGYCPDGEGYAIGFRQPKSFKAIGKKEGSYFRGEEKPNDNSFHATWQSDSYQKCIYLDKDKEAIRKDLAQKMESSYNNMPDEIKEIVHQLPEDPQEWKAFYNYLNKDDIWFAQYNYYKCLFKDKTFAEEREYRLFIIFNSRYHQAPCYRVKKGVFIPFHRFCFDDNLFQEIIVRKTPREEQSCAGLGHYLKHNKGMDDEKIATFIKKSKIPFRD